MRGPLARCGFFYTGEGDIVECYMCHVKLRNWPVRHYNIELSHRIFSLLDCPLIANREIAFAGNIEVNEYILRPGVLSRNQDGTVTYLQLATPFSLMRRAPPNEARQRILCCLVAILAFVEECVTTS
ncbi:hypothetical protein B566_EDAN014915 [Ephemera danica]|nr:hypothetical protein B566_EDAN014915 [Ephemera danica]